MHHLSLNTETDRKGLFSRQGRKNETHGSPINPSRKDPLYLLYDKIVINADKSNEEELSVKIASVKIASEEHVNRKDQHSARKMEYDHGVGHVLYTAIMHSQ